MNKNNHYCNALHTPVTKFAFMNRLLLSLLCCATIAANAALPPDSCTYTFENQGVTRSYGLFLPHSPAPGAPVVYYTHGYGSSKQWLGDLNRAADSLGMAVVYPAGLPDSRGRLGWKVGYPSQEAMTVDEAAFFKALIDTVAVRHNLSASNVFMAGMSNGGDLCYHLVYTAPQLFRAYGSVAGLLFDYTWPGNKLTLPVPFVEIHGDADTTSRWEGDPTGSDGWGIYIPVPDAVEAIARHNGTTVTTTGHRPLQSPDAHEVTYTRYSGAPSGCDVVLYRVHGAKHSWHAKDMPTATILLDFFARYINHDAAN